MNETGKVLSGFFAVVAGFIAAAAWSLDPVGKVWTVRLISTALSLSLFVFLIKALLKKDLAPDFLRMVGNSVFERSGFQFLIQPLTIDGEYCFRIWYQNRHMNSCKARILLTSQRDFLMKIPKVGPLFCELEIPSGGFGHYTVLLNAEKKYHGKKVSFGVYADTVWPQGKGELLRFRDGINVGTLPGTSRDQILKVATLASGGISTPAKYVVTLPFEIKENPVGDWEEEFLWKYGDNHNPFE